VSLVGTQGNHKGCPYNKSIALRKSYNFQNRP